MRLQDFGIFDCFLSGGRDSALACYIAYRVARALNKKFRLVHIDTRIALQETKDYVERYAEWLGADLIVVRTPHDYFELVKRWGYPSVLKNRWCWRFLKQEPLYNFRVQELREREEALWVLGIRRNESMFRLENYGKLTNTLTRAKIKNLPVAEWLPILYLSSNQVDYLIKKLGIPQNPVWSKVGISGECLCLAGTTKKTLEALFTQYPEVAERFYEFDKSLTPKNKNSLVPLGLWSDKKRLYEFIEELKAKKRQSTLVEYMSCQGACFVF